MQSLVGTSADGGRIVVGFSRDDALPAARLGHVRVEFLRSRRVVRIWLPPEVHASAVAELDFPPLPLHGAYVVGSLREPPSLFVDLQLGNDAVLARASVRHDPALVVVDFRPGGSPLPGGTSYRGPSDGIVLVEPVETHVSYPLEVSGYARTYEGHVAASLSRGDTVLADTFTTAGGGRIEIWGEFRMRFGTGPIGDLRLHVSGEGGNDEAERPRKAGVEIPVVLRTAAIPGRLTPVAP